jgi:phosphoribosylformylglycinamidine synthase I
VKVAIIQFPGSNCDWDAEHSVQGCDWSAGRRVWHKDALPDGVEAVIVPGGFSFGDYLRCGAIARFSPIMTDLKTFADQGGQVLGICNGFQILCESGLLPGALVRNDCMEFRCLNQPLKVENSNDRFNTGLWGTNFLYPSLMVKEITGRTKMCSLAWKPTNRCFCATSPTPMVPSMILLVFVTWRAMYMA